MSTTLEQYQFSASENPSPWRTCYKTPEGYEMCFYGGFVSQVETRSTTGGTQILWNQKEDGNYPYRLPGGADKPWPSSVFEFRGGPSARDFALQIYDPLGQIDRIEVVLKPTDKASDRAVVAMQSDEQTIVIRENPICCPPTCP
ncbi:MAG TPA: hypothetical protein VFQ39_07415 [Longimicrobium sp.]|nr:hypothetical protein [Longimicrobium sp.]